MDKFKILCTDIFILPYYMPEYLYLPLTHLHKHMCKQTQTHTRIRGPVRSGKEDNIKNEDYLNNEDIIYD